MSPPEPAIDHRRGAPRRAAPTRRRAPGREAAVPALATIDIRDLRLRTYVGFNPDERTKRQDVVINIRIVYRLGAGVFDDQVDQALDYKTITKAVIDRVENARTLLLEKLTADVLRLCTDHPAVERARVRIDKPHALRFADSVSLTLEYPDTAHDSPGGTLR